MSLEVFGRFVDAAMVENAVKDHIQLWLPTYLAEAERQQGFDPQTLPLIREYASANSWRKWPEEQLPACLVVSPGTVKPPMKDGEGQYRGFFAVGIGVIVSSKDQEETERLAKLYVAVLRAAILQHQRLGEFDAAGIEWREEKYTDIPNEANRTLASGQAVFIVEVSNIVTAMSGPAEPYEDPYTDQTWPTVEEAAVTVEELVE